MGGCGGVSRSGEKIDEFISEALLASLEDKEPARRKSNKPAVWTGAGELKEVRDQLDALTIQWNERKISNEHPSSHGGYEA